MTNWVVTLGDDLTGVIEIPDNLGGFTLDLNGHVIAGTNGVDGADKRVDPATDGGSAILIVPGDYEKGTDPTRLFVTETNAASGQVKVFTNETLAVGTNRVACTGLNDILDDQTGSVNVAAALYAALTNTTGWTVVAAVDGRDAEIDGRAVKPIRVGETAVFNISSNKWDTLSGDQSASVNYTRAEGGSGTPNAPDYSWNWRLHDPQGLDPSGRKSYIEYNAYDEARETVAFAGGDEGLCWSSDASGWFPGLRVEAAYELYRSNRENDGCVERRDERPWGVDIAVAFAYYFQRGLWKTGGEAASAAVRGRADEGYWQWWNNSYDEAQYILDYYRDTQFHDGMWGAGSFEGPGAELAVEPWQYRDVATGSSTWSAGHSLRYCGDGDYREYSIELLARPWWEPWEWLRVFGSIGVEISRREFEWRMDVWGTDGSGYRESGDAADWRALWRFGGDDLGVDGRTVHGGIEHGDWGFRLSLGYEF